MLTQLNEFEWVVLTSLATLVIVFNPCWLWQQARLARRQRSDLETLLKQDEQQPILPGFIWICQIGLQSAHFLRAFFTAVGAFLSVYVVWLICKYMLDAGETVLNSFEYVIWLVTALPFLPYIGNLLARLSSRHFRLPSRPQDEPKAKILRNSEFGNPMKDFEQPLFDQLSKNWSNADLDQPRTILDTHYLLAIADYPLDDHLREPRPITSNRGLHKILTRLGLVYVGLTLCILVGFKTLGITTANLGGIGVITGVLFGFTAWPMIRRQIPISSQDSSHIQVGPGFLQALDESTWTAVESTMVVRSSGWRHGADQPIKVWFGNARNSIELNFDSARDKDFITLWTMWNSLHPRPELADKEG